MIRENQGFHSGVAISAADPPAFKTPTPLTAKQDAAAQAGKKKPAAPKERRVVFTLKIYEQPAQNRQAEIGQILHAANIALQKLGEGVGHRTQGEIMIGYDQATDAPTIAGDYLYEPSTPL